MADKSLELTSTVVLEDRVREMAKLYFIGLALQLDFILFCYYYYVLLE